jgi:hypothetical protein
MAQTALGGRGGQVVAVDTAVFFLIIIIILAGCVAVAVVFHALVQNRNEVERDEEENGKADDYDHHVCPFLEQ